MEKIIKTSGVKFVAAALAIAAMPACGMSDDVAALPETTDRTTHALSLGDILELNGSYGAGCKNRSGDWSVPLISLSSQTNTSLSVLKNNSACVLTLKTVRIGVDEENAVLYDTGSNIALGADYKMAGSAFEESGTSAVKFYANARMEPDAGFANNFVLRFLFSNDPSAASASKNASFIIRTSSATTSAVSAPDYTASTAGLTLQTDADDIVESATGTVGLTDVSVTGDHYVVSTTDLSSSPSYADIDAAYLAGTESSLSGSNPTIPAADFALVSEDLSSPVLRSLIIAKTDNGNRAYEVITITFNHG